MGAVDSLIHIHRDVGLSIYPALASEVFLHPLLRMPE
jgi:hypothetical protein